MNRTLIKTRNSFLYAAVGAALFAAIYELFSHQVYSNYLIFAFLFPLLGGFAPYALLQRNSRWKRPDILTRCLYNSGLATLTVGSIFQGILEIYGTTNHLSILYWAAGCSLLAFGLALHLGKSAASRRNLRRKSLESYDILRSPSGGRSMD